MEEVELPNVISEENSKDLDDSIDLSDEDINVSIDEDEIENNISKYEWVESKKYWFTLFHVLLVIFGIITIILLGISSPGLWKLFNHDTVCENTDQTYSPPENSFSFADMFNLSPNYPIIHWINPLLQNDAWISVETLSNSELKQLVKYSYSTDDITNTKPPSSDILPRSSIFYSVDEYPQDSDVFIISPDGEYILFGYDLTPIYRHSYFARWEVCESETSICYDITNTQNSDIRYIQWSNTNKISYIKDNNIFIITDISEHINDNTIQITNDGDYTFILNGASDWAYEEEIFESAKANYWSDNSNYIAYIKFEQNNVPKYNFSLYNEDKSYPELYEYKYPCSGEDNSIVSLWVYDIINNNTINVPLPNEPSQYISYVKWINNNELSYQILDHIQHEQSLFIFSIESENNILVTTQDDARWIDPFYKYFSIHNGEHFIIMEPKDGYKHFVLYDRNGNIIQDLNDGEMFDVEEMLSFDENRDIFYYSSHQPTPSDLNIYSVQIDGKHRSKLTTGDKVYASASFSPSSGYYALYSYGIDIPSVSIVSTYSYPTPLTILEDNNEFSEAISKIEMPERKYFEIPIESGENLNSMMYLPPGFSEDDDKIYPVLLYVYGGPDSQTVNYEFELGFWYLHSYLSSSLGIIVVSVDNRGTCCKGQEFLKQTYLKLGELEVSDQIAVMNYVSDLEYIDSTKIAIWGWSYGGFMSASVISSGNDIVRGAISISPVTDWKFYDSIYTERYMQTPSSNKDGYASTSVLKKAENMLDTSSYLLVHGTADDNVHFQNSADWVTSLVNAGKEFDTMYYPDKTHSLAGIETRIHLWKKVIKFLTNIFELPTPTFDNEETKNIQKQEQSYSKLLSKQIKI